MFVTAKQRAASASRADWVHYLVQAEGQEQGRRMRLSQTPLRIGRRASCDWVLADSEVSGLHCEVVLAVGTELATVTDLDSTNGTFVEGAKVQGTAALPHGAALQIGAQLFKHEFRSPREIARSDELDRDLAQASRYVMSLLPPPIREGKVRTEWVFQPSASLGGDAFGYFRLDEDRFVGFLIDVSGHGLGAAVHTVSVLNVLRQRALPEVDFADPAQVLAKLNAMFSMDEHGGLFFTFWYGVYDAVQRRLRYASAGHHAAYLVDQDRSHLLPLRTRNPVIGAMPQARFTAAEIDVLPGCTLHVFSDGVFEIQTRSGQRWTLADFTPLLLAPPQAGLTEPQRLVNAVRALAQAGSPDDDVSLLSVTFLS